MSPEFCRVPRISISSFAPGLAQRCEQGKAQNTGVSCLLVNDFAPPSVLNESFRPFLGDA